MVELQELTRIDIDDENFPEKCLDFLLSPNYFISFADGLKKIYG